MKRLFHAIFFFALLASVSPCVRLLMGLNQTSILLVTATVTVTDYRTNPYHTTEYTASAWILIRGLRWWACQSMPIKTGTSVDSSHSCHLRMHIAQSPRLRKRRTIGASFFEGRFWIWEKGIGGARGRVGLLVLPYHRIRRWWFEAAVYWKEKWEVLTEKTSHQLVGWMLRFAFSGNKN